MKLPIAKEGFIFIFPLIAITVILLYTGLRYPFIFTLLLTLFVIYFFRDPERKIPTEIGVIVSPADGKVVNIKPFKDQGEDKVQVSIFLSIFNVHVNRLPYAGVVKKISYNPGKFLAAFEEKASLLNEQNSVFIEGENGIKIVVKQIAGLIARRIVCWVAEGDKVEKGDRFGLIRFGSRVDILLPASVSLDIKVGDHLKGGESIVGRIR